MKITDNRIRQCPKCGRKLVYTYYRTWYEANKNNSKCYHCRSLGNKGNTIGANTGRRFDARWRKSLSNASIIRKEKYPVTDELRKKLSDTTKAAMHRPDIRERHIKALAENNYLGRSVDKGQLDFLKKWNTLGFHFEPNYRVHTDTDLFYVDGYDKDYNVVLEYDSKYHLKPYQKQKDLIRQKKIIDILHPKKFWRYDAVNKQFRSVL